MGSHPISLDIGLVLLVFGSSFRLTQNTAQTRPISSDTTPSNKDASVSLNLCLVAAPKSLLEVFAVVEQVLPQRCFSAEFPERGGFPQMNSPFSITMLWGKSRH